MTVGGPAWAKGLDQADSRGPFQPQSLCDSVTSLTPCYCKAINTPTGHKNLTANLFPGREKKKKKRIA